MTVLAIYSAPPAEHDSHNVHLAMDQVNQIGWTQIQHQRGNGGCTLYLFQKVLWRCDERL